MKRSMPKTLRAVLIMFGVFLIATLAYGYLFYRVISIGEESRALAVELRAAAAADQNAAASDALLRTLAPQRAVLEKAFLSDDGLVAFLEQIEGLGVPTNTTVKVVSVDNGAGRPDAKDAFRFSVSAEGGWQGVYQLFSLLETMPFVVTVGHARFEQVGGESAHWQGIFDFSVARRD